MCAPIACTTATTTIGCAVLLASLSEHFNGRSVSVPMELEDLRMREQSAMLAVAALVISCSVASAQKQGPTPYDGSGAPIASQSTTPDRSPVVTLPEVNTRAPEASGAPVPETTGQAANFEDRWSAQRESLGRPPAAATPSGSTGHTPSMSKKMGPEMESTGDQRASPDDQ